MSENREARERQVASAYDTMNAGYRIMDEWMRQGQKMAETLWLPWMGSLGSASPFVPPEQWIRMYGDIAMAWVSLAEQWTSGLTRMTGTESPRGSFRSPPGADDDAPASGGPRR